MDNIKEKTEKLFISFFISNRDAHAIGCGVRCISNKEKGGEKMSKVQNVVKMFSLSMIVLIGVILLSSSTAGATAGIQNVRKTVVSTCLPGQCPTTINLSFDYQRGVTEGGELHWEVWFWEDDSPPSPWDESMAVYGGTFKSISDGGNWMEHVDITYKFDACPWILDDSGDCIEVYATIDVDGTEPGVVHHLQPDIGDICCDKCDLPIPEFSTIAIPAVAVLVMIFLMSRRKRKE